MNKSADSNKLNTIVKHVTHEKDKENDVENYSYDSPKIMAIINNKRYAALVDTGASASVCSEALYNLIIRSGAKLIAMPTCGLYCLTATGHSKKKIRTVHEVNKNRGRNK